VTARARIIAFAAVLTVAGALAVDEARTEVRRALAPGLVLRSVTGERIELDALRHSGPVLLDFWATWCKPCLESIPELEALHERWRDRGLTVIGISIDGPRNFARVRPFASRLGIHYPIVLDEDGRLQEQFRVREVPTTVLFDTSGVVVRITPGYRPGETTALEAAIVALLPAPRTDSLLRAPQSDSVSTRP
jgi:cytochrome c biogenesis protein CcmG, thiol:disulfide interchange protein DsbE